MFFVSLLIFIFTLISIIVKPFNKNEYIYTVIFCIIALIIGTVSVKDTIFVIKDIWNAVFSLISIMIISSILDDIGFFKWAALTMAFTAEGSTRRLFVYTIFLGALVSIFFNNDGTILILTPIVYEMVEELGFEENKMLPFLFACTFIADTASMPLVVSNLANIVNADTLGISFNSYLMTMFLPGLTAIISVALTLYFYFRRNIYIGYNTSKIRNPDEAVRDWIMFNMGVFILVCVIIGYFFASKYHVPVSIVSATGALLLLIAGNRRKAINSVDIIKKAPWGIILFAFGMYLIVYGLYKNGFYIFINKVILILPSVNKIFGVFIWGLFSSLSASTMNNLPSVMIGALSAKNTFISSGYREIIAFANVIGNDIGAKITPIGSLATIMWINILKKRNINITWKKYTSIAIRVLLPVIIFSLLTLGIVI